MQVARRPTDLYFVTDGPAVLVFEIAHFPAASLLHPYRVVKQKKLEAASARVLQSRRLKRIEAA